MRVVVGLAAALLCAVLGAQVPTPPPPPPVPAQADEKPAAQPPEPPLLRNTGKPMLVEYRCSDEDIQSAGLSCTQDDPCPVYLELSAVEAVGNRIFLAGNIHSSTATLYSVLLASDDAGKTWREPYPRIRAAGLDRIQFVDFENGWVGGEVLSPLPRDPFLLITTDAGKEWRSNPIFSEPRFGSILQFWFTSRTNGALLIDRGDSGDSGRYELYETPNSGETWMLRAVNERPIQMPRVGGTPNTDWRIRADAPTKSFRIEHRAGGRWQGIAGFAVSIGECRPPVPPPSPVEVAAPVQPSDPAAPQKPR